VATCVAAPRDAVRPVPGLVCKTSLQRVRLPPASPPLGNGFAAGSPKPGLPVRFRAGGPRHGRVCHSWGTGRRARRGRRPGGSPARRHRP